MAKEWIDVIDTAVKIGLGALITGATTFFVTKTVNKFSELKEHREHKRQLLKDKRERKARIAEQSLENVEPYLVDFIELLASVDGIIKGKIDFQSKEAIDFIKLSDDKLLESRAKFDMCESKLKFIGFLDSARKLNSLAILENDLRTKVIFTPSNFTIEEFNRFNISFTEIKKSFFKTLNLEYEQLFIEP